MTEVVGLVAVMMAMVTVVGGGEDAGEDGDDDGS